MNSYCWGQKTYIPRCILDESDDDVVVEINGKIQPISKKKGAGRVSDGDRIQVLVSGGRWLWGYAQTIDGALWAVMDNGKAWPVGYAKWLNVVANVATVA